MYRNISIIITMATVLSGCGHFITDRRYRETVYEDFNARDARLTEINLSKMASQGRNTAEDEALAFLYAYMPESDIVNYTPEYFAEQVEYAFRTRKEMDWGKTVPEDIFRHFVLPPRANNEALDEFRNTYYKELAERVKGLSLYDAALQVNRWCHEHVTYTPSDSRTSSPMASIRTATGRCGEESVLAVAAMRTVGIPARQVYTPRWAHTDDNHAWVEVWADGKWYFLGACEPAPALNMAWFNEPASRAMLMHTRVFGKYFGDEDIIRRTPCDTEINVIENYVPVRRNRITVTDSEGKPVEDALVEFKIYNYGEFYPVVRLHSDETGSVRLTTGKGDMLVWASKDDRFGYGILSDETLEINLCHKVGERISEDFDIVPPVPGKIPYETTEEAERENEILLAREDSIRNAYTATFADIEEAKEICDNFSLAPECAELLTASCGNSDTILSFLNGQTEGQRTDAVELLKTLSAKDLRDAPENVLEGHIQETVPYMEGTMPLDIYYKYVLSPRITNEALTNYKAELAASEELSGLTPSGLVEWCNTHLANADATNPYSIPISPAGVLRMKTADRHSRDIFFVAVCRAKGIPARIEQVTGKVQYYDSADGWHDISFEETGKAGNAPKGYIVSGYSPAPSVPNPEYYRHFTIGKYARGSFSSLNFEDGDATELGAEASWTTLLKKPYRLDAGYYNMTTGTRMASGKVLAHMEFFPVNADKKSEIPMVLRHDDEDLQVIGYINAETPVLDINGTPSTILSVTGRGYYMVMLPGIGDEPSNHAMRDIASTKKDLEVWGRQIIVALPQGSSKDRFNIGRFGEMPENMTLCTDLDNSTRKMILSACKKQDGRLPVIIIADSFGRVVYLSTGYNTSLGSQIVRTLGLL